MIFKYPNVSADDECDEIQEGVGQLVMDMLCSPCALKLTEKYLNMLICCKLSKMNDGFKSSMDQKKKTRRSDKAKKLNIARLSQLMEDGAIQLKPKKTTKRLR